MRTTVIELNNNVTDLENVRSDKIYRIEMWGGSENILMSCLS